MFSRVGEEFEEPECIVHEFCRIIIANSYIHPVPAYNVVGSESAVVDSFEKKTFETVEIGYLTSRPVAAVLPAWNDNQECQK